MTDSDKMWGWLAIFVFVMAGFGWASNLVKLFRLDFRAPYKAEVIRVIGLSPLGIIIGYVHLED